MIGDKTYSMSRATFGNFRSSGETKGVLSISYGYTNTKKKLGAASNTAVHAAITASDTDPTTVTTGFTNPDAPRNLIVKPGGTAGDVKDATAIVVTGTNVEGKTISETFTTVADTVTALVGNKAFKTVTSITIPAQDGAAATFSVGVGDKIGLNHRMGSSIGTPSMRVVSFVPSTGVKTLQSAPSAVASSTSLVESNTVTPATVADGTFALTVHYMFYNWHLDPTNDQPSYGA